MFVSAHRQGEPQAFVGIGPQQIEQPSQFAVSRSFERLGQLIQFGAGPIFHLVQPIMDGARVGNMLHHPVDRLGELLLQCATQRAGGAWRRFVLRRRQRIEIERLSADIVARLLKEVLDGQCRFRLDRKQPGIERHARDAAVPGVRARLGRREQIADGQRSSRRQFNGPGVRSPQIQGVVRFQQPLEFCIVERRLQLRFDRQIEPPGQNAIGQCSRRTTG